MSDLTLPTEFLGYLDSQGYRELYPPQDEAVRKGVLEGRGMLITTPTASGKTLVALMASAKTILEKGQKVVYLTPLRALASEKHSEFKGLEALKRPDGGNVEVLISTGDYDSPGESLGRGDLLILTNEKFDSVLRHGVTWLERVGLFVADEVHLLGDSHRGSTLEILLTKILAYAPRAQLLALSATITNSRDIAKWLGTEVVDTEWRPVKLIEGVYDYGTISFQDGRSILLEPSNRGLVIDVAIQSVSEGGQSLIFCETRRRSVALAEKASEITNRFLNKDEEQKCQEAATRILAEGEETELSRRLSSYVRKGAAFHHAGLSAPHRRAVEDAFKGGGIKILTSTPTLAAGVNLPARRVVLSSLMRYDSEQGGQAPISVLEYKQMCGRAGRPRYDPYGETVLIATPSAPAEELIEYYIKGRPEPIRSKLAGEGSLRTHLLATVSSLPGMTDDEIYALFSRTLFASQSRPVTVKARVSAGMVYLLREGLIEKRGERRYLATEFGKRVSMLYIDPATGVLFRDTVKRMDRGEEPRRSYWTGILHLISSSPDFTPRFHLRSRDLEGATLHVEEHKEEFIYPVPSPSRIDFEDFISDYRTVLVLDAWASEWSEDRIMDELGAEPGDVHRAVENADWLLYSFGQIAQLLGRSYILPQVEEMRVRVKEGVRSELLPLVRLKGVGRVRSRALYNAGFTEIRKLASATPERLARIPKIGEATARSIVEQAAQLTR